jgi:hypothetical protein
MNRKRLLGEYGLLPTQDPEALAAWAHRVADYLASPSEAVEPIIKELAAIADACADLHQNRNAPDSLPLMGWDNAKLTLGTVRLARALRDRS